MLSPFPSSICMLSKMPSTIGACVGCICIYIIHDTPQMLADWNHQPIISPCLAQDLVHLKAALGAIHKWCAIHLITFIVPFTYKLIACPRKERLKELVLFTVYSQTWVLNEQTKVCPVNGTQTMDVMWVIDNVTQFEDVWATKRMTYGPTNMWIFGRFNAQN